MPLAKRNLKILAVIIIGAVFLFSLSRMYVVPPIFSVQTAVLSIWLIIITIGVIASYMANVSALFGAGLFVLMFAFFSSLLAGVGTIGEYWRVVAVVEANPDVSVNFVRNVLVYGILPTATGLLLCILAYVKQTKILGSFSNSLLLITGVFFVIFGVHDFQFVYRDYLKAISSVSNLNNIRISDSLRTIYITYEAVGILWSVTGMVLIAISVYSEYKSRKAENVVTTEIN